MIPADQQVTSRFETSLRQPLKLLTDIKGCKHMTTIIGFHHGVLSDSYEKQANAQGYTLGAMAKYADKIGFGLIAAYINGCITEAEYKRIIQRFQKKILVKNLKRLEAKNEDKRET